LKVPTFSSFQMHVNVLSFEGTVTNCLHFVDAHNLIVRWSQELIPLYKHSTFIFFKGLEKYILIRDVSLLETVSHTYSNIHVYG
jgi:hypothetical protein